MADLIDRAVLIAEYEYLKAECYEASGDAWDDIIDRVKKQPRVDAEPVRHAYWIIFTDKFTFGKCSICGMAQRAGRLNYCPECGAKMDEEVEE